MTRTLSRRRSTSTRPAPAAVRSAARTVHLAPGALEHLEDRRLLSVSASWDLATNTGSGPTNFGGQTFDDAHAPQLLLDLGSGMAEVQSFSWGVANTGSATSGGGTGAGRADLGDLSITADLGPAAAGVFHAISSGRHLPRVVFEGRDSEGGDVQFRYTLDDVLITSYQTGGSAGATDAPSESVSLDFAAITFQQFEYDHKALVETHTTKWSGATNTGSGPFDFGGESFAKGGEPPIALDFGPGSIEAFSFSWGANQTGSTSGGGGGGGGKVNFSDLNLTSASGDASPSLMFATASGRHIPEVVLDSHDSDGNRVRYTLEDVLVTSFQTSGNAGGGAPSDNFSLNFASIEVEQFEAPDRPGPPTPLPVVEWDLRTNTGSGPTDFGGETFSKGSEPEFLLDLGTGMVALQSWSWSGSNPGSTSTGGGGGGGVVNFGDFSFIAAPSAASPALIYAVASGRHLPEATLVVRTRNDPRHVDARYTLEDVFLTSYQLSSSGNGTDSESVSLGFSSVALEQTHYTAAGVPDGTRDFSWDIRTNTGTGTAAFDTHTLGAGATGLVLKLGNYELGARSFSFGVSNSTSAVTGGTGTGRANFSDMSLAADLGEVTPNVLFAMSSGSHVPRAVLQQRDDDGNVVFEYVLEDVTVASYSTGGSAGGDATDSFSLEFDSIELTHTTRDQHGGVTGTDTVSWDLRANTGDGNDDFAGTAPDEPLPPNRLLIDGEELGVFSLSWGASNPATISTGGGGGGAGKVNFFDLSFQLSSGAATPSWLLATAKGVRRPEVVLESRNADGDVYLRYTLTDVGVSSVQSSGSSDVLIDSVSLNFAGIELEQINPGATQTTDWNIKTNTGHGQADFGDQVFPAGDEPPLVLQISGDELAPFSYSIGASNPAPIFGGGGGGGGKVNFSELNLTGLAGIGTAGLLYSVASGRHIPQVVLEVRSADGDLSRTITLEDVLVTTHQVFSADPTTFESYTLDFRAITFTTADGGTPAPLDVTITGPAVGPEGSPLHLSGAAAPVGGGDAGELDFEWAVTRNGASVASGSGAAIDFIPADDGTYVLTLSASAANGATGTASRTIVVTNVAPTLSLFGSATVNERTPYSITFSATDPGADTISTWTVDWGDGTAVSLLPGSATSAGHQYATGGQTYVITLTATDEDGSYSLTRGVSVLTPKQAVEALAERLNAQAGTLGGGNANALQSKLDAATKSLATNKKSAAGQLGAFINQLEAWSGKKLPASVAASLIAEARAILALL